MKYYLGQEFERELTGFIYRLVQVGREQAMLICFQTNNRWEDIQLELFTDVTKKQFVYSCQIDTGFIPLDAQDRLEEGLNELCKDLVTATSVFYVRGRIEEAVATEVCVNLLMETCRLKRPLTEDEKVKIIYG